MQATVAEPVLGEDADRIAAYPEVHGVAEADHTTVP